MIFIFLLFYFNVSFFVFEKLSSFINSSLNIKQDVIFGFINQIPLVLWFTSVLFFCFALWLKNRVYKTDLKIFLKVNLFLFTILLLYSTYFLIMFYLIKLKFIDAELNDLIWIF